MAKFIVTVESQLSSEMLFDYLADMRNVPKWDPGVSTATLEGDPNRGLQKGSRFRVTLLIGGRPREVTYELAEYDRPRRLVLRAVQRSFTSIDVVTVQTKESGRSSATYDANLSLQGIFRLAAPLVTAVFKRIGQRAATGLRKEVGA